MPKSLLLPMLAVALLIVSDASASRPLQASDSCSSVASASQTHSSCDESAAIEYVASTDERDTRTPGVSEVPTGDVEPRIVSPDEALAHSLALIAEANGWSVEEATAKHVASEAIGRVAQQVMVERPDIFVGSVMSPDPGGPPSLYIKGPADGFIRKVVAEADVDIKIVDNQPFSFEELQKQEREVARALQEQGFSDIAVGFRVDGGGLIEAGVARIPGLSDKASEILSGIPESLRSNVELTAGCARNRPQFPSPIVPQDGQFGVRWVQRA